RRRRHIGRSIDQGGWNLERALDANAAPCRRPRDLRHNSAGKCGRCESGDPVTPESPPACRVLKRWTPLLGKLSTVKADRSLLRTGRNGILRLWSRDGRRHKLGTYRRNRAEKRKVSSRKIDARLTSQIRGRKLGRKKLHKGPGLLHQNGDRRL